MKKKLLGLIVGVAMAFSLVGCGGTDQEATTPEVTETVEETAEETTTEEAAT